MSTTAAFPPPTAPTPTDDTGHHVAHTPGPLGRLGVWVTDHARLVTVVWLLLIVGLGAFAPKVEANLSGAGWQADGSESVAVRELAQEHFGGNASSAIQVVVHCTDGPVTEGAGKRGARRGHRACSRTTPASPTSIAAAARRHAQPGRRHRRAPRRRRRRHQRDGPGRRRPQGRRSQALSGDGVEVNPTGASLLWSDFNEANLDAMLKSEMFSWPVTLAILVLAFGALVAAGLPLILTLAGLVASAGSLVLINELVPVSIWAMNFAMMFALALGIDYALFLVVRFRAARMGHHETPRAGDRRDHGHRRQGGAALRRHRAGLAVRGDARARRRRSARWPAGSCSRSSSCSPPP